MKNFVFWLKFDVCPQGSNWQSSSIGLDNGFAPNRRQAIIWTNADPINWRIYATLGGDELTQYERQHFLFIKKPMNIKLLKI